MENVKIISDGKEFMGHQSKIGEKNLVYLKGSKGYIMCGYLNKEAAENFHDVAAIVSGVSSVEDILGTNLVWVSEAASELGLYLDMTVKDALKLIY